MGYRYIYTIYDAKSGKLVAKGSAAQLVWKGLFHDTGSVATCYLANQKTRKPRKWKMEREPEKKRKTQAADPEKKQMRKMHVYTCYAEDGRVMGTGTARELVEQGLFGSENSVSGCYLANRSCLHRGIFRMTREQELRALGQRTQPKQTRKPEAVRGITNPTALQWDVHALELYNREARAKGRPELNYGAWVARGKPERPFE